MNYYEILQIKGIMYIVKKLDISYPLPDFNAYDNLSRGHWSKSARLKKQASLDIKKMTFTEKIIDNIIFENQDAPYYLGFEWLVHHTGKKLDPDNIAFAKKIVLDGLQPHLLEDDSNKYISGFIGDMINYKKVEKKQQYSSLNNGIQKVTIYFCKMKEIN